MIVEELDDRAGPAVGDDQRQRVGFGRARVDEVHARAVDLGDEVVERVEPRLGAPPVVLVAPVRDAARRGSRARCRSPSPRRGAVPGGACAPAARAGRRGRRRGSSIRNGSMASRHAARRYLALARSDVPLPLEPGDGAHGSHLQDHRDRRIVARRHRRRDPQRHRHARRRRCATSTGSRSPTSAARWTTATIGVVPGDDEGRFPPRRRRLISAARWSWSSRFGVLTTIGLPHV